MAEGHHMDQRPPSREAGVPPAGTSVRRAQRAVYASLNEFSDKKLLFGLDQMNDFVADFLK